MVPGRSTSVEVIVWTASSRSPDAVEQRSTAELAERPTRRLDGVIDVVSEPEYASTFASPSLTTVHGQAVPDRTAITGQWA